MKIENGSQKEKKNRLMQRLRKGGGEERKEGDHIAAEKRSIQGR